MSAFNVPGVQLDRIEPHPGADRLDCVWVGDYMAVTQKGRFTPGDRAIYVPEQAIVPESLLRGFGFWDEEKDQGMLAGPQHNRVKAVKLRGILSQGILITPYEQIEVGKDYADDLAIVKWVPPIPAHLAGEVWNTELGNFSYTDIENVKKFPDVLQIGEMVYVAEKLHGTCFVAHCWSEEGEWKFAVSSKGFASTGRALKESDFNFYWRIAKQFDLQNLLTTLCIRNDWSEATLFGEGLGVQDLKYGFSGSDAAARFFDLRVQDTFVAGRRYLDYDVFLTEMKLLNLPTVPVLTKGPYHKEWLAELTVGKETLTGTEAHVREGVVVRPEYERDEFGVGRVIFKSVSESYLLRGKKGEEVTEYE